MMDKFQEVQAKLSELTEKISQEIADGIDIIDNPMETPEMQKKKAFIQCNDALKSAQSFHEEGFTFIEEKLLQSDPVSHTSLQIWKLCNSSSFLDMEFEVLNSVLDYEEPDEILQDSLNISDELLLAMYGAANKLYEEDELSKAQKALGLLVTLNPGVSDFWLSWGLSLHHSELFEPALHTYLMASSLNPENPYPHVYSAQCLYALKEEEGALEELDTAIDLCKTDKLKNYCENIKNALNNT
jgi:type III secretion system low calcium response chaperone LcrH/SycD